MIGDIVETALFTLRIATVVSSFIFVIASFGWAAIIYSYPVLGTHPLFLNRISGQLMYSGYFNAMMSSFLTFALRLYQRKQEAQVCIQLYSFKLTKSFIFSLLQIDFIVE